MDKILLTPLEAAAALGIGRSKVYELLQSGQLPSVHVGRCRRVHADAVRRFATSLTACAEGSGPSSVPRLVS